ncbi:MAG: hypothetical protein CM15mP120_10740 [Pseudomonadota bacterium]|nr:MAG: hypothetical protein CM15mP120_10740 [Pseudomonadota bacterium]
MVTPAFIDVALAAESKDYCDELRERVAAHGVEITELSTHLEGQLVACTLPITRCSDGFAPQSFVVIPRANRMGNSTGETRGHGQS